MPKFPHYQQHDQLDCGPTYLRMVAKHYGRHFTAQSLRERAELGKEGVSLLGIARALSARRYQVLPVSTATDLLANEGVAGLVKTGWGKP